LISETLFSKTIVWPVLVMASSIPECQPSKNGDESFSIYL